MAGDATERASAATLPPVPTAPAEAPTQSEEAEGYSIAPPPATTAPAEEEPLAPPQSEEAEGSSIAPPTAPAEAPPQSEEAEGSSIVPPLEPTAPAPPKSEEAEGSSIAPSPAPTAPAEAPPQSEEAEGSSIAPPTEPMAPAPPQSEEAEDSSIAPPPAPTAPSEAPPQSEEAEGSSIAPPPAPSEAPPQSEEAEGSSIAPPPEPTASAPPQSEEAEGSSIAPPPAPTAPAESSPQSEEAEASSIAPPTAPAEALAQSEEAEGSSIAQPPAPAPAPTAPAQSEEAEGSPIAPPTAPAEAPPQREEAEGSSIAPQPAPTAPPQSEEAEGSSIALPLALETRRSTRLLGKKRNYYGDIKEEEEEEGEKLKLASPKKKVASRKLARFKVEQSQAAPAASSPKLPPTLDALVQSSPSASKVAAMAEGGGESEVKTILKEDGEVKNFHVKVKETLRIFTKHYLEFVQKEETRVEEAKSSRKDEEGRKHAAKRPDLKAISKMKEDKSTLYHEKRIGHLPGIDVGYQFFSRAEMVVLGMHSHWLNGIDFIGIGKENQKTCKDYLLPLAVCVVLSGMYEDDIDESEEIIYTGQGGQDLHGNKQQIEDQKLERGNLALLNNFKCSQPVRVVRGHKSPNSYTGKFYTYDGLYKVSNYWAEKGARGFTVYKYKLNRLEGQPHLTTNQVNWCRAKVRISISDICGLVLEDISNGQEHLPIPVTNTIDDPPFAPTDFVYCKSMQVASNLNIPASAIGCQCKGDCTDSWICACARLNENGFPYVRKNGGRLIEAKAIVFECGPNCGCNINCINRISQQGLKYRLEVFRTMNKGWGVRSWDSVPAGAPICEYIGMLMNNEDIENASENNYIFDIDCLQTMKGLDGRERRPGDVSSLINLDDKKTDVEYCIDAGTVGNIARFINHSCQPNLFVQCVLSSHHDVKMAKIMLFAADTIPPLMELTYDYGYTLNSVIGSDGEIINKPCQCGAEDCRKWLY